VDAIIGRLQLLFSTDAVPAEAPRTASRPNRRPAAAMDMAGHGRHGGDSDSNFGGF